MQRLGAQAFGTSSQTYRRTLVPSSAFVDTHVLSTQSQCQSENSMMSLNPIMPLSIRYKHKTSKSQLHMNYVRTEEDDKLDAFLEEATANDDFFASPDLFPTFESMNIKSPILLQRVYDMLDGEQSRPSAVQAAALTAIRSGKDVNIGAETGSGKTLAYLLPLIDDILQRKQEAKESGGAVEYDYARAIILVPNKELGNQALRMAVELCGGPKSVVWSTNGENMNLGEESEGEDPDESEMVRLGFMPGGLKKPEDYKPIRVAINDPKNHAPLDLIITTPASLAPIAVDPKNINMFADINTLVIDEADMLFDGGYLRPLNDVLLGFRRADRLDASFGVKKTQHILVAATLPNMGLKSAEAYVMRKFPYATKVTMKGMHNARHYGLKSQTQWIQDDEYEDMPKKKRMEKLIEILQRDASDEVEDGDIGLAGEKVMVFVNSGNDVDSAAGALKRAGINAIPFHAKIPLGERTENLSRYRKFDPTSEENDNDAVQVLVCTDLAARGLDIPGVTSVVQLQFAGNVVSHLHRMGRCGRAGNRNGRGVIFYGGVESELIEVVRQAESDQQSMVLKGNDIDDDDEEFSEGKVKNAFSRKRGFTKKRKKIVRKAREGADYQRYND
jgi:superfamily II DNA/RNA helicase